jgi:DNA-binding NarL/FixJ family response regulator
MEHRYSIVIIEDHALVREGIKAVIDKHRDMKVIGEAEDADEGYRIVVELKPDLLLLDISLHGVSGLELAKKLLRENSNLKIIVLTMYSKIQYIIDSLEIGIKGYVLKETSPDKLIQGIEKVLGGGIFVDSYVSNKVISKLMHKTDEDLIVDSSKSYESLTLREQEVLRLLVEGQSVKQIAEALFISAKTVENHRANIMTKLKCKNVIELVRFAAGIGLIEL